MNRHRFLHSPSLLAALGGVLVIAAPLAAQSRDTSVRINSGAIVDVTVRSGRLVVRGIDGNTGTVRGSTRDYQLRSTGVTLQVGPRDDSARRRDDDDMIELDVPRGVRLVVSSRSADVEVHEIDGSVEVRSTAGNVVLDGVRGRVIAETLSGDVRASGGTSVTRINTVSGDIRLRESRGDLEVHTTSGDVSVSGTGITRFMAESMSGDVQFDGLFDATARVQVNTHSGDVTMRVPDGVRGRLEFSTVSGDLTAGGPVTIMPGDMSARRRGRNSRQYEFGPGSGSSSSSSLLLDITTFSGNVRLVRSPRS